MILGLASLLLSLALPVVVVVLVVRYAANRQAGRTGDGHGVRRFFQYLLLLGLLVVVAVGLVDLGGQLVGPRAIVGGGGADLARALTFVVVGLPIFLALVTWTRRGLRADPGESLSLGWAAYLTVAALVAVVIAATAVYDVVVGALADQSADWSAVVRLVVWGAVWAVHWRLAERTLDAPRQMLHHLLGTLIGWATSLVGLVGLLSATIDSFLVPQSGVIVGGGGALARGAAVLLAGAPIWAVYWVLRMGRARTTPLWLGYVLVGGVGVSLVMTVVGASVVVYRGLVWFVGEPGSSAGAAYAQATSVAVAAALVGLLSWWYHRAVLADRADGARSEVTRVYEYLLSAIALLAAAAGVALVITAFVEAVTPEPVEIVGASLVNAVLAALTLLVVGGPLWWTFWRRIGRAAALDPADEAASPTRRTYLFVLFGAAGVVAVVSVLVAAFLGIDDALQAGFSGASVRDMRVPLGLLVAAGAISAYHWQVYRADKALALPRAPERRGPRQVLLVGPRDDAFADQVRHATGARVDGWVADGPPWDVGAVMGLLAGVTHEQVLVVARPDGPLVVEAGAGAVPFTEVRQGAEVAREDSSDAALPVAVGSGGVVSGADVGEGRDQPRSGGEQREPELEEDPEPGGAQSDQGRGPGPGAVTQA